MEHRAAHRRGHRCCARSSAPARPGWWSAPTLPGRRIWAVLLVVPLAIPDFVVSFGWASLWNWVHGFRGAVLVMTLAVYPLVYLPVAASLRAADPGQEEVARSLGVGRLRDLRADHPGPGPRRHPRRLPAGRAGAAGRVRRVRDAGLPDLHHRDLHRVQRCRSSVPAACALSLVLVVLSLLVLAGEGLARGRGRAAGPAPVAQRAMPAAAAGPGHLAAVCWRAHRAGRCWRSGVPVAPSVYWIFAGGAASVTAGGVVHAERGLAHRRLRRVRRGHRHRWPRCRSRCWPSGTPAGSGTSWSAAPTWCWPCPAWSSASRWPTSPSATRPAPATRPRRCWSSATRSCSSRSPWSGSRPPSPGPRPAWTRWPARWARAGSRRCAGSPCGWPGPAWPPPSAWSSCRSSPS